MTDWKTPPDMEERDVASLWQRMGVLEDAVLRVVSDERRDPLFKLLAALAAMMATLQRRILRDERWNRRCARKREMLGLGSHGEPTAAGKAMRMNMCDRLGGVEALERWEVRARGRLGGEDKGGAAGLAGGGATRDGGPGSSPGTYNRGRGEGRVIREFGLPRLPSAGGGQRGWRGGVRSPARRETPIAVWPCEVMPERFEREWWETTRPTHQANRHTPNTHTPHKRKFPENRSAVYPGPSTSGSSGKIADVGGLGSSPGACVCERKRAPP